MGPLSTYFIALTELGLIVQVQPSTVTVLDAASYNTFSLVCTATVPANVTAMKQFVWRQGPSGSGTIITASAGTTISTVNLTNATSTSVLSTSITTPGTSSYTCDVMVLSSVSSATATVTVNGAYNKRTHCDNS